MNLMNSEQQQWEAQALESFMAMVKAADGDIESVRRLSNSLSDTYSFRLMVEFLSRYPQARQAFQERSCIGQVNLQQLHQLPEHTFGYAYADHMLGNGLTPLQADQLPQDEDSFLIWHLAESHDIWHVITGCDTNILGEIELEAFSAAQFSASRLWLALLSKNLLKAAVYNIEISSQYMDALTQGWVRGKQAKPLFGIKWKTLWEMPLEQLRTQLNLNQVFSEAVEAIV